MLGVFTAANLLPQQAMLIPLYRMFMEIPLPTWMSDRELIIRLVWALILVNIGVPDRLLRLRALNYMKTLPQELYEAARGRRRERLAAVLAASPCRCAGRPLAALATLEVTWIYNEFFWATVLMRTGDKFPVTSAAEQPRASSSPTPTWWRPARSSWPSPTLIVFFAAAEAVRRGPDPRVDEGVGQCTVQEIRHSSAGCKRFA